MRLGQNLLCLPASLLILIASQQSIAQAVENDQSALEWPFYLPPHVKYWPEDPPHRRRDLEAVDEHVRLGRNPVGVMKMSDDEGEKFFMEYWQFEGDVARSNQSPLRPRDQVEEAILLANASATVPFKPAFALHAEFHELKARDVEGQDAADVLAQLQRRAYECPGGTASCSSIGYPNSCCATGETCYQIPDTGLGSVACCAAGSTCGDNVSTCAAGYTSCGSELGGGCCIPGYVCAGVGCTPSAVTVAATQTITAVHTTSSGRSVSTSTVIIITTSGVVTITATQTTETYTGLQTTLACTNGYSACPVNQGGGCCLSGRICGSLSCPLASGSSSTSTRASTSLVTTTTPSATGTGVAPVRPTSATVTTSDPPSTATGATTCPTGFYACSAYYVGGCCRTGRDCQPTSCPPTSSTTIVSSGVTIVVPVGSGASTASTTAGTCATGWFSCAASEGGNCCPSGYACGTASCSSVGATSTVVAAKEGTSGSSRTSFVGALSLLGFVAGFLVL
ncbi:hypothetical protein BP5796_10997 [Coleophoma crateriformis]|uniref:GPI anchored protein n=1 Tax=Coleophoma crateriformis TaxID=565419 RepID=A0A3D8QLL9_9HELO|nr:hypothetical protein BP5796_10997 [Coleophoma crateriformis]